MSQHTLTALAGCAALTGCQLLLDLEDRSERPESSDAGLPPLDAAAEPTPPKPETSCAAPSVACGNVCVDLRSDPSHCGECDHSCLGGTCARGECVPEKLADVAYGLIAAVDDAEIFYRPTLYETLTGPLLARNKTTGAERTVVPDLGRWYAAALRGDELVVIENGPIPRIRRIDRKSGASTVIYEQGSQSPPFQYVVTDGDTLYFTTRSDIRKIHVDGSGYAVLRTVDDGPNGAWAIAVTDTRLFFSVADSANLYALDKASPSTAPTLVASGGEPISTITVIDGEIIWTSGPALQVLTAAGSTKTPYSNLRNAHSAASRDGMLYIYDVVFGATESRILRFDTRTNTVLVLASGIKDGRLAVDDTHVYFANYADGLYRVPR